MAGLSSVMEIAKNTLLSSQVMLQTASHNIANADNKTYARQKTVMATNPPYQGQEGYIGTGAYVQGIVQERDEFIERRLMSSISQEAQYKTQSTQLSNIESSVWDNGEQGISLALGNFWDAWEGVNSNPTGTSEKTLLTQATQSLASAIQDTYNSMVDSATSTEGEIKDASDQANSLLSDIAKYNSEIVAAEAGGSGQPANDLRDLRYQAMTKLAEIIPIKSAEEANGAVTLTIQNGSDDITLVSGDQAGALQYDDTSHTLSYTDSQQASYSHTSLSGGSIQGLLNVYTSAGTSHDLNFVLANPNDSSLTYLDRLNAFAASLVNNSNSTHSQAGGSNVFDAGVISASFNAGEIKVDSNFTPDAGQALNMADLQNKTMPELNNTEFSGYLANIQQKIGIDQQNASTQSESLGVLRQQIESQQQSVSGVSIDEEMVSILQYQQVYQAAAKIIQQSAEMLNTVIQMVR